MKKNEKLFDAIGQIDERYIAEALEPMYQESAGTSDENKAAMPKKGKLFFYRQRRTVAAAAALVICIGAAGIDNFTCRLCGSRNCTVAAAFGRTRTGDGGL